MDARLTEEQRSIRDTVARMVRKAAVSTVSEVGDGPQSAILAQDLRKAGFLELRDADAGAMGVEVALVAEQLAAGATTASFVGPVLAADLCRRAGIPAPQDCTIALAGDASRIAGPASLEHARAFDASVARRALLVTQDGDKFGLATAEVVEGVSTLDLSRPWGRLGPGSAAELAPAVLSSDDLASWRAFGHAVLAADLLGAAHAAHTLTVGYATERTQYGRSVASFQAVQHLLAESLVLLEGAESAVNYAAWAVDVLPHDDAVDAGLVSKLYCTNAARTICEIAIQVHGGIGNTWDCMVHIYLRRVLMAGEVLGDESTLMDELVERRLQVA